MKYSIKFTAAELEMLNIALCSGSTRFQEKAKDESAEHPQIYAKWAMETDELWMKVYAAQKIVRAIEAEQSERAA